jgi:hypothetical protein
MEKNSCERYYSWKVCAPKEEIGLLLDVLGFGLGEMEFDGRNIFDEEGFSYDGVRVNALDGFGKVEEGNSEKDIHVWIRKSKTLDELSESYDRAEEIIDFIRSEAESFPKVEVRDERYTNTYKSLMKGLK